MAVRTSGPVFAAVLATGVAASAYVLWQRMGLKGEDEEEEYGAPDVRREVVVKFFDLLNFDQANMVARFSQQLLQFRGKVPDQQLIELAASNFESHLAETQEKLLKKMGVSAEDMEDASKYYAEAGDEEVLKGMKQLKALYLGVVGVPMDEAAELPDDLTEGKMVEAVKVYFAASIKATRDILESLRAQGKNLGDPSTMMEMNFAYQKQSQAAVDAALKKFNLDASSFQHALEKYSDNIAVQKAVKAGSEEQQQLLTSFDMS